MSHALTTTRAAAQDSAEAMLMQGAWFAAGVLLSFAVPFAFTSLVSLQHDVYYLIYFASVAGFLAIYTSSTGVSLVEALRRNWRWSLAIGVPAALFAVFGVFRQDDATPHPDGLYYLFEIAWRGVAYGVIDALLLSAFPGLVAYALLRGDLGTMMRKASYGLLALVFAVVITATYHLGYEQYRDEGVAQPETGNVVISLPMVLTANPLGSIGAHVALHLTAVTHAYETETFLPPQTDAD